MKRSEVTVERLTEMGYKGYRKNVWNGIEREANYVLEDIAYAAKTKMTLNFTHDDVRGEVTVSIQPDEDPLARGSYDYIRRKMTPAELTDADLRLAAQGVTVQRG